MTDAVKQNEKEFWSSVEYVKTAPATKKPSQLVQLEMYGLFKQATQGDVTGSKPGLLDVVGRSKYKAWSQLKGVPQEVAMQRYIDEVSRFK